MPLLSLKNDWQLLLFEPGDSGEVWKLFCELQSKLRKALLFNEAIHVRNELTQGQIHFSQIISDRDQWQFVALYMLSSVNICNWDTLLQINKIPAGFKRLLYAGTLQFPSHTVFHLTNINICRPLQAKFPRNVLFKCCIYIVVVTLCIKVTTVKYCILQQFHLCMGLMRWSEDIFCLSEPVCSLSTLYFVSEALLSLSPADDYNSYSNPWSSTNFQILWNMSYVDQNKYN